MSMIHGVLLDVKANICCEATIDSSLDTLYKALDCDCIDITDRSLFNPRTGKYENFTIVVDDEGLLKSDCIFSAYGEAGMPELAGNLFFCGTKVSDDGTELASLTKEQCETVLYHCVRVLVDDVFHQAIVGLTY